MLGQALCAGQAHAQGVQAALHATHFAVQGGHQHHQVVQAFQLLVGAQADHRAQRQGLCLRARRGLAGHGAFHALRCGAQAVVVADEFIAEAGRVALGKAQRAEPTAVVGLVAHGDEAGEQWAADEDAAVHFAVRALELHASRRLWGAAAPTAHPGLLRHGDAVGRVACAAPGLGDEAFGELRFVLQQLLRDGRPGGCGDGGRGAATCDERPHKVGRHQETDLFTVAPRGHVHADEPALLVQRRAAAHAGGERPAEEQGGQEAALGRTVVVAFGHGKAHVQRVAHAEDARAARQRFVFRPQFHRAAAGKGVGLCRAQQGHVMQHVKGQQLQCALAAVHRGVDQPVARGLQRKLADHVVVGHQQPAFFNQEAGADRGLAVLRLQQGAHLQQPATCALVDALAGAGDRGVGG